MMRPTRLAGALIFTLLMAAMLMATSACSTAPPSAPSPPPKAAATAAPPGQPASGQATASVPALTPPAKPDAPSSGPAGQAVTINVSAQNMAFDKSEISVPSGASVTIVFNNKDAVPHNIGIYETSEATKVIFRGENITSQKTIEYKFTAPATPGTYFFRCDVHPARMTGKFIVAAAGAGAKP